MVVILAAGMGTRFGNKEVSKCSINICGSSPVDRIIRQFYFCGESKFIVILGNKSESVINSISKDMYEKCNIVFVYNEIYDKSGCAYSLSRIYDIARAINLNDGSRHNIYIVEGDSVYSYENVREVVNYEGSGALCRSSCYLCNKSVVASYYESCNSKVINKLHYDKNHCEYFTGEASSDFVADSMQIWKISTNYFSEFIASIKRYIDLTKDEDLRECVVGLADTYLVNYFLSHCNERFNVIFSKDCDGWVNINEQSDISKAEELVERVVT